MQTHGDIIVKQAGESWSLTRKKLLVALKNIQSHPDHFDTNPSCLSLKFDFQTKLFGIQLTRSPMIWVDQKGTIQSIET